MTDAETLLVVLVVVYLIECFFWVRPGAFVFRAWWNRNWRLVARTDFLANDHGQLCWSNPFPPFGSVYVARTFPLCLSPQGVRIGGIEALAAVGSIGSMTGRFYPFEAIDSIEANDKKLMLNRALVWRSDSVHQPAALAALLRDLKKRPPEDRAGHIQQELAKRFDIGLIATHRKEFRARTRSLEILTLLLFVVLFGACPVAVWLVGLRPALLPMLMGILSLTIVITVLFRRRHKDHYPDASDDRFKLSMLTLLVPAVSIRARELLGRSWLESFHPLAVAREVLDARCFAEFSRRSWRELKYPFWRHREAVPAEGEAVESWFRSELLAAYEIFLAQQGVPARTWLEPPVRSDSAHELYCPRCETQFTGQARECAGCGGHPLEKLEATI
ncbi:MAG TPA: hypothetical protein VK633_12755 [Verrucomicrobiae bacterium]|nr:hypothetical protein [Verrucomicrobiae bacterium]